MRDSLPPSQGLPLENGWDRFAQSLKDIREADFLYGNNRIYIKKAETGYLLIVMGLLAPFAMVRMSCDMISPALKRGIGKKGRGLKGFFKIEE